MAGADRKAGSGPGKQSKGQLGNGQFGKGRSGNPKGRPRGGGGGPAPTASAFDILFEEHRTVSQDGGVQARPMEEVLQLRSYKDALAGNKMARREVIRMITARETALAAREVKARQVPITLKAAPHDPRNADAALLLLGIAARDLSRDPDDEGHPPLKLQTWAIQLALSRRRGGAALSQQDVTEIKRTAAEPDKIRWPRRIV